MKIVLATNNLGKAAELNALLAPLDVEIIAQAQLGVKEVDEKAVTFLENALIKARHAAKQTGLPAIADDSGLIVPALNGAPGIYSARYAGKEANTEKNIAKLLSELAKQPFANRHAYYYCALIFIARDDDPTPSFHEGTLSGSILKTPRGKNGFGYDPIFFIENEKKSVAELSAEHKNKISHRGIAIQSLIIKLSKKLAQT